MEQLQGFLSKEIGDIRAELLDLMSDIEANIDYPEYDIEEVTNRKIDFLEIGSCNVPQMEYDSDYRTHLKMKLSGNETEFEKFVLTFFFQDIPTVLLEGFNMMKEIVSDVNAKKVIHAEVGDPFETAELLLSSRCNKVYTIASGGEGNLPMGRNEAYLHSKITDVLYTTGWKEQYDAILKPITIPRLYKASRSKNKKKIYDLLYISGPIFAYRFTASNLASYSSYQYVRDSVSFLNQLAGRRVYNTISARIFAGNTGWNVLEKMKSINHNIHIDLHKNPMMVEVNKSRLCVIDYIGTTWIEVLASNTPLILIVPEYVDFLSVDGERVKERLSEVGIWHSSYSEAIDYICNIAQSIEDWWYDSKRQLVVKEIMKTHAHVARNVKKEWYKEFLKISKE